MKRRSFIGTIAAFFGLSRVAKADEYRKAEEGYRLDAKRHRFLATLWPYCDPAETVFGYWDKPSRQWLIHGSVYSGSIIPLPYLEEIDPKKRARIVLQMRAGDGLVPIGKGEVVGFTP